MFMYINLQAEIEKKDVIFWYVYSERQWYYCSFRAYYQIVPQLPVRRSEQPHTSFRTHILRSNIYNQSIFDIQCQLFVFLFHRL